MLGSQPPHPPFRVYQHGKGVLRSLSEVGQGLYVDSRSMKAAPEIREAQPPDPTQPRAEVLPRPTLAERLIYSVQRRQTLEVEAFGGGSCLACKLPLEILE